MNKTITSNIAGYVFHIDENAFDKLDAYLNTIRSYFKDSQGRDEIIADIEARLAEMLHERIGDMKQVVTLEDVNHVIQVMGQPEAFVDDDPENAAWTEQKSRPSADAPKRLFRDPDNRVVGGVCSGISSYLGIHDPIWLRLALVGSVLIFGSGVFLYIILWIIIPEARTTAEKLQMRGENVTVSNIERKVNEELEAVKDKWNGMHGNSGPGRKVGNFIHRFVTLVGSIILMLIKFIAKFIGIAFLIAGVVGFISILAIPFGMPAILSLSSHGIVSASDAQEILNNLVGGTGMMIWIYIAGILVCGIPLLGLAFVGFSLLTNFRRHTKGVGLSLIALWIIGVIMSVGLTMSTLSDFSTEGVDTETVELNISNDPDQVIYLGLNHELGDDEPNVDANIFSLNLIAAGNAEKLHGRPELDINLAKTGGPKLIVKRRAKAGKKQDAMERASKIDYGFITADTAIFLNGYFSIPEDELWRTQEVKLDLQLPVGYTIFLSEEMIKIIYDIDNTSNTYDGDMVDRKWTMTPNGLACVDCEGLTLPKPRTPRGVNSTVDQLQIELEMKQRELEMEQERLEREMDQRQRELDQIEREMERQQELEEEKEEASSDSEEILLRRVINASYWINPTTYRNVRISYPG